ncbi:MAG: acetyl-CoA acetyltransferase [Frankiales bacterium]|nr:acetyl-CoA acetyltransferase [Frankiales bacterium]
MTARRAVIVDVVRTPFGKGRDGGALSGRQPADSAGLPVEVPDVSIDRKCGSFQQPLHFAAQGVIAGAYDVAIGCGAEMMSALPMRANRIGRDELGPKLRARFPDGLVHQGVSAELIAARWELTREEPDAFALRSHLPAAAARDAGPLVPIASAVGGAVTQDESIRATSAQALAALSPAFTGERTGRRFPEIDWNVTAGNSSPVSDGAAATLVMSEQRATQLGLEPKAAVTGFAAIGTDPIPMLSGVPPTRELLARTGLGIADIDLAEVSGAFAGVVLAWAADLGVSLDPVTVEGGAIAYGHPVGASGGRLLAALVDNLQRIEGRYGLMTMCESGGMANATLLERAA